MVVWRETYTVSLYEKKIAIFEIYDEFENIGLMYFFLALFFLRRAAPLLSAAFKLLP